MCIKTPHKAEVCSSKRFVSDGSILVRINPMPCHAKRLILVASYQPTNQPGSKAALSPQPVLLHRAAGNCLRPGADLERLYALQSFRKTHSDSGSFCASWTRQERRLCEKWKYLNMYSRHVILKLFCGKVVQIRRSGFQRP